MKYRVFRCPTCDRRRRIVDCGRRDGVAATGTPARYQWWRCSQGHTWAEELCLLDRINEVTRDALLPRLTEMFQRDDPFYAALRRK